MFFGHSSLKTYSSRPQKQNEDFVQGHKKDMTLLTSEAAFRAYNAKKSDETAGKWFV